MHNILLEISISKTSNRYSLLAYQSSRYSSFCLIETSLVVANVNLDISLHLFIFHFFYLSRL